MHLNIKSDNIKLLFEDTSLEEKSLLVKHQKFFFKFGFNIENFTLDFLKDLFIGLAAFKQVILFFLKELLKQLSLVIIHVFVLFVHPLFTFVLLVQWVLVFFKCQLIASQHFSETSLTNIVS